jgi:hypothetical protein
LANLYLHYAFDVWMQRNYPAVPFERYADDIVCHCRSKEEGEALLNDLAQRLAECKLQLHPVKTRLVYCKDGKRRGEYPDTRFDFLGFSFHARTVQDRKGNPKSQYQPLYDIDTADVGSSSEPDGSGLGHVLWGILSGNVKALSGQNRSEAEPLGKEQVQTLQRA